MSTGDVTFGIGQVAERTGVPISTLRYYDELGLVRPSAREAGRRRYDETAIAQVGMILVLRDVGFTLAEIAELGDSGHWEDLAARKLEQLAAQAARLQEARTALEHALACPHEDIRECPNFWSHVGARLQSGPLADAH